MVLARRGDLAAAAPMAEWAERVAREITDAQAAATAFPPAALTSLGRGNPGRAVSLLFELERTPNVRSDPIYVSFLPEAVRTALASGDPELAARLAERVEPVYPLHEHALITVRALLAEHRAEYADAEALFADAVKRWERFEMPWEQGQALLGHGRCLLALGRVPEVTESLRTAREIFTRLGAKPALSEVDALLARATALSS